MTVDNPSAGAHPDARPGSLRVAESLHYAAETAANLASKLEIAAARLEALLDDHAADDTLLQRIDTLLVLLDQCIRLVANLRSFIESALYDRPSAPSDDDDDDNDEDVELEFDLPIGLSKATVLGESEEAIEADVDASLAMLTMTKDHDPQKDIQDLLLHCGMFFTELQGHRTRLARSRQSGDRRAMLEEADVAQGKANYAMHSVMHAALRLLGRPAHIDAAHLRRRAELDAALLVRSYLMGLRDELESLTAGIGDAPDEHVAGVALTARHVLDRLRSEASFRALRWPDRYAFSDFARRIRHWLNSEHPTINVAREVLGDLGVYASLLGEVNRREILITHDRRVQQRCLDELRDLSSVLGLTSANGWRQFEAILRRLARMAGRHRPLDMLVREILDGDELTPESLRQSVTEVAEALLAAPF